MYRIESAPFQMDPQCPCCGERPVRITKFITKNDKAWGAYYGLYSNKHPEKGLQVLLSLGPWWEEARPDQRTCFYFQVFPEAEEAALRLGSVAESSWGVVENMGRPLTAEEAEIDLRKEEAFRIADLVGNEDLRIRGFFQRVRGGDADYPLEPRFGLPDAVFQLSEKERKARAQIYSDVVSLDGYRGYIRINLPMPLEGRNPWFPAIWAEVSPEDYDRLADAREDAEEYLRFTCVGRIANNTTPHHLPNYLGAEVMIRVPGPQKLPVAHESSDSDLHKRLTEPWGAESFHEYAVLNGFL